MNEKELILPKHFEIKNKYALITGAAGLLGFEHAYALLELGAAIILTDINNEKLISTKNKLENIFPNSHISYFLLDVTNESDIVILSEKLRDVNIIVDILINNAAIDPKVTEGNDIELTRFENFQLGQWIKEIQVGLTGAFLMSKHFGTIMSKKIDGGVILNIASDLSVIAPDQRLYKIDTIASNMQPVKPVTYSVIKSGIVGLTRYLSTYWAQNNIRVNSLSPGGVENNQNQIFKDRLTQLIPMGRMAKRKEYRGAVQYLCSDASSYLTGQNIIIDGGRSVW